MAKWLLIGVCLYGASLLYLYFTQEGSIFNAKAAKFEPFTCKDCADITLNTKDKALLWGKSRLNKSTKLLIYFGGNADDATTILKYLDPNLQMQIVAFNYRGYGKSSGKPTQKSLFSDALTIYDTYALGKEVVVMGRSLGTGVATYLASKRLVNHLILITPYDSIREIARAKYPYFPISWLIKHPFDSTKYTPKIQSKISVVEVLNDKVVPNMIDKTTHGEVLDKIDFNSLLY